MDIIFDVDGTLMDITHRRHHVMTTPKDFKSFRAATGDDTPNMDVFAVAIALKAAGNRIIISSGRNASDRAITNHQLLHAGLNFDAMFLRKDGDHRQDHIVKGEMLDDMGAQGFFPTIAFDDRQQVVGMWRAKGLRVFQVAPGDF